MTRQSLATALVHAAMTSGEDVEGAMNRAQNAFGEPSLVALKSTLAQRVSASEKSKVAVVLAKVTPRSPLPRVVAYSFAMAIGLTLAAVALVVPASSEVGLGGW